MGTSQGITKGIALAIDDLLDNCKELPMNPEAMLRGIKSKDS
jgi:hypothetical protein